MICVLDCLPFVDGHLCACTLLHRYFLIPRRADQLYRQLTQRAYSKWYCARSGVCVFAGESGRLRRDAETLKESLNFQLVIVLLLDPY